MKLGFTSTTMNHHRGVISATHGEPSKGVPLPFCTPVSPVHDFLSIGSEGRSFMAGDCPSPFIRAKSLGFPSPIEPSSIPNPPKYYFGSEPSNDPTSLSPASHIQNTKSAFSRSSVFCTSLYQSSSSSSETHRQLGNLPFLPPPTCSQSSSAVDSTKSPLLFSGDLSSPQYEDNQSEALMKDFLNLQEDRSHSHTSFHGLSCESDGLELTEQLELQFFSDELDIAIADHGETPRVDVSLF